MQLTTIIFVIASAAKQPSLAVAAELSGDGSENYGMFSLYNSAAMLLAGLPRRPTASSQ